VGSARCEHEQLEENKMAIIDAGPRTDQGPMLSPLGAARADRAAGNDDWGAFSVEKFAASSGLTYTHEDAAGFLAYLTQFYPANFHYMDAGVAVWAYEEAYDAWQDQYGMDACCAVYHSGHGGMTNDGVFWAPMGAAWSDRGTNAISTNMALGNEAARYIFWSTCVSLRVLEGHSPVRTWWNACQGFRMLFGYETVSVDDPNYGKNFWNHWVSGKPLSRSWLDASWQISTHQAPSAMAVGANEAEATNRLYNERFLTRERATRNWFQWTWYYAAKSAQPNMAPPSQMLVADFAPPATSDRYAQSLLERFELDLPAAVQTPRGIVVARDGDEGQQLALHPSGAVEVRFATPQRESDAVLSPRAARSAAEAAISRYGLASDVDLAFDKVRVQREAGGTDEGSGERRAARTIETTVEYRQVVNGLPVVTPGAGVVRVTIDNEGTITRIHNATRSIDRLQSDASGAAPEAYEGRADAPAPPISASEDGGIEAALAGELRERLLMSAVKGPAPVGYDVVPGSTVVGYDQRGDRAIPVVRREVELDFGGGLRKRYAQVAPLSE
jgi:hypothetical protein